MSYQVHLGLWQTEGAKISQSSIIISGIGITATKLKPQAPASGPVLKDFNEYVHHSTEGIRGALYTAQPR